MEQYWEHGWYYLAAEQSMEIVISFGDMPQGLQFIAAEPRGSTVARMDIVSHGIHTEPRFAAPQKVTYHVTVANRGPEGKNFVIIGVRVG